MRQMLRREDGAGTVIEYTFVFPAVLLILGMLLIGGFGVYHRGVLEGAVERQAIYAAREMSSPSYVDVVNFSAGDLGGVSAVAFGESAAAGATGMTVKVANLKNQPYRYVAALFEGSEDIEGADTALAASIDNGSLDVYEHLLVASGNPKVTSKGRVFRSALATAQEDLRVPFEYSWFKLPAILEIPVEAEYPAIQAPELINNLDMVADYYRASGLEKAVNDKFSELTDAITKIGK